MEPFTTAALAAALMTLVNGAAGEAGKASWTALTTFIKSKFARDSTPVAAITAVEHDPQEATATRLALTLQELAQDDTDAGTWLDPWFAEALTAAEAAQVSNTITGNATVNGPVVQGHTFTGTINF